MAHVYEIFLLFRGENYRLGLSTHEVKCTVPELMEKSLRSHGPKWVSVACEIVDDRWHHVTDVYSRKVEVD